MMRQSKLINLERLKKIFGQLVLNYPNDWLLVLEIYEVLKTEPDAEFKLRVKSHLEKAYNDESIKHLIADGIRLIEEAPS